MDERFNRELIPNRPRSITVIDHEDKVGKAIRHLIKFDLLGYDTETYNIFDRNVPAFEPVYGARMRLAQFCTPEGDAFVFDLKKVDKKFLHYLFPNKFLCVIHNSKFEIKFLQYELGIYKFGPIWDTLVVEQVLSKGRVTGKERIWVGLAPVAKRLLNITLPKDYQASEWYRDELSPEQIRYAARDPSVVLPIFQLQRQRLQEQGQIRVAELECRTVPAIAWMENVGIELNCEEWLRICDQVDKEIEEVKQELWSLLGRQGRLFGEGPSLNLNSQDKVMAAFEDMGLELPINPETGEATLKTKFLKDLNNVRAVQLYIKYVKLAKRVQSYGPDWVSKVNPYTKRIHCSLEQIGAETGRMACKKPNLMQVPKDDNSYRNCFVAQEGWAFVDPDYSQCELRILADLCRDKNLLQAFDSDQDIHSFTGHLLYEVALEKVSRDQRSIAKNQNFLIVYGGGPGKLATEAGIPLEVAEATMKLYLEKVYPDMGRWLETQGRSVLHDLKAYTMTGRIRQYAGDLRDKEFKGKVQRNAKNLPIQGTNADMTKLALCLSYEKIVERDMTRVAELQLAIHDELLASGRGDYALEAEEIIVQSMLTAERSYLKRVPAKVDSSITKVWCKEPSAEQLAEGRRIINEYK